MNIQPKTLMGKRKRGEMRLAVADIDSCEPNVSNTASPNDHTPGNPCVVIEHGATKITIRIE